MACGLAQVLDETQALVAEAVPVSAVFVSWRVQESAVSRPIGKAVAGKLFADGKGGDKSDGIIVIRETPPRVRCTPGLPVEANHFAATTLLICHIRTSLRKDR